ncbi:peptidylprolyl isomerase [Bacteroides heparinolyticus]|uniref:peptidylprolyl isomerase n=1 Tax=Prevotella heparinolytica TaxID=28113 RepID=UPI0035A03ED0
MVRLALISVLWGFVLAVSAQNDPVLMRIDGKEVFRSEFERFCDKKGMDAGVGRKELNEYVDSFVSFKLKVAAAKAAGLDTATVFLKERERYRNRLVRAYLTDMETAGKEARDFYDKMKSGHRAGQVLVKHVFKYLPQNISGHAMREVEHKMDSVFRQLEKANAATDFDVCVNLFSDDKSSFWVSRTQMPIEFEDVVFGLKVGEFSRPFFTPQGIHIAKVLERKEFDEVKDEVVHRQTFRHGENKITRTFVEKLKKEYRYTPDKAGIDELLSAGSTRRTLFTLDGKSYTGEGFSRFAAAHPAGVRKQLEEFVMKIVLDYENSRLERKHPEFRMLLQEHCDSVLLAEIIHREIGEEKVGNEAELKGYFETHRSDFHWGEARYKGMVLHCATKRVAKQARKLLKKLPETEWKDAIRLTFNAEGKQQIQAEQGTYAPGDNGYVDQLVFGKREMAPVLSYPFTIVLGKKQKGPDSWEEVHESVAMAYRNHLEALWTAKLRSAAKVEFEQEVLKTVNNH